SAPALQSPANNATGIGTNAGVQWAAASGATGYHVQISADSTFATTLVNDSSLTGAVRTSNGLAANTTYFWRVRAKNAALTSWWTGYWKFRTGGTTSVEGDAAVPHTFALFQNHPNPFNPSTEIRFDIPARSIVRLSVYNMLGQKVATLVDGELAAGFHTATWQGGMASGVYLYRLEAISTDGSIGGFVDVKRMVLVR
ncbi:MAG: T9SS type A sorting domain-containing protein, partial [Bacteroidota bacterium]